MLSLYMFNNWCKKYNLGIAWTVNDGPLCFFFVLPGNSYFFSGRKHHNFSCTLMTSLWETSFELSLSFFYCLCFCKCFFPTPKAFKTLVKCDNCRQIQPHRIKQTWGRSKLRDCTFIANYFYASVFCNQILSNKIA